MQTSPPSQELSSQPLPISTGWLRLDLALGTGGILPGDVVEISGPADSGKTTLCLRLAAEAGRLGCPCIWLDADALLDPTLALRCGADPRLMLVIPPLQPAIALDILVRLASIGAPLLIIVDSLTGLLGPGEPSWDNQAASPGAHPAVEHSLSLALRRISLPLQRGRLSLVFTRRSLPSTGPTYHQLSAHLSRLAPSMYTGVRIRLGAPAPLHDGRQVVGQRVSARVQRLAAAARPPHSLSIRKKIPPCYGEIVLDIMYNQEIIRVGEVFDLGLQLGLIDYRDGAFIVENRVLGLDRAAATAALERLELADRLEQVIRLKLLRNDSLFR